MPLRFLATYVFSRGEESCSVLVVQEKRGSVQEVTQQVRQEKIKAEGE